MYLSCPASKHRSYATALFRDGAQSLLLSKGETLGELAGRIEALGARQAGSPIAIQVHFDASDEPPNIAASRH